MNITKEQIKIYAKNLITEINFLWSVNGEVFQLKTNIKSKDKEINGFVKTFTTSKKETLNWLELHRKNIESEFVEVSRKIESFDMINANKSKLSIELLESTFKQMKRYDNEVKELHYKTLERLKELEELKERIQNLDNG